MISLYLWLTLFVAFVLCHVLSKLTKKTLDGKIPPGPTEWPVIGNILHFNWKNPLMTFPVLAEKYGKTEGICSFKMGFQLFNKSQVRDYIISDFKIAKELFTSNPAFAGRLLPGDGATDMFTTGQPHGIVHTEGDHWVEIRRFTLRQLRDFGFGKSSMESLIVEEMNEFLDWMKTKDGQVVEDIRDRLSTVMINALWKIISGQRFSQDDPRVIDLKHNMHKAFDEAMTNGGLALFIPRLKYIIPELSGYNMIRRYIETFRQTFMTTVQEHKQTYESDFQRDFIDTFLQKIKSCTDTKSAFYKDLGERHLIGVITDLFAAGADTTSVTLEWAFLYFCTFPNVQEKLQEELDRVVGKSRQCLLADRPALPYAQALLSEVLRFSSIVPPGNLHRSLSDQVFHGWAIPAGTLLWINLYGIHRNKEIWGDPEIFRPERFLSPDGTTFQKHEALIPFSIGRRQCAGKTLARDSLFLYMTNIFQRFKVTFDPTDPKPNPSIFDYQPGFHLKAKPFKMLIRERNE